MRTRAEVVQFAADTKNSILQNKLDKVLIEELDRVSAKLGITVGAEAADTVSVVAQAQKSTGLPLGEKIVMDMWLSSDSEGVDLVTITPDTLTTIDGTTLKDITSKAKRTIISDATGKVGVDVVHTGAFSAYPNFRIGSQKHETGDEISLT